MTHYIKFDCKIDDLIKRVEQIQTLAQAFENYDDKPIRGDFFHKAGIPDLSVRESAVYAKEGNSHVVYLGRDYDPIVQNLRQIGETFLERIENEITENYQDPTILSQDELEKVRQNSIRLDLMELGKDSDYSGYRKGCAFSVFIDSSWRENLNSEKQRMVDWLCGAQQIDAYLGKIERKSKGRLKSLSFNFYTADYVLNSTYGKAKMYQCARDNSCHPLNSIKFMGDIAFCYTKESLRSSLLLQKGDEVRMDDFYEMLEGNPDSARAAASKLNPKIAALLSTILHTYMKDHADDK